MRKSPPALIAFAAAALCGSAPTHAIELHGGSFEAGSGNDTRMFRVGLQRDFRRTWFQSGGHHLGAYWDLTVAAWRGDAHHARPGEKQNLFDLGLTPVFRYRRNDRLGWYGEAGIGIHHLSQYYDNNGDQLSTRFQFGDHLGLGYVFANGLDLGLKFQHFSNGGVKEPNGGVNFVIVKAGFRF